MNFFKRRAILKKANYLELVPVRLEKEEVDAEGKLVILIPKFTSRFAQQYVIPRLKFPYVRLKTDELSAATWFVIDGKKKVSEIIEELVQKFGDKIQPAEERIVKFLTLLYEQKLITFREIH